MNLTILNGGNTNNNHERETGHGLTTWAIIQIKNNKLSKENLKTNDFFKTLSMKQKQAIYYQLRKKEKIKDRGVSEEKISSPKEGLPFFMAVLLLAPLAVTEYQILKFGADFYQVFGFSPMLARMASATMEMFFMFTRGSADKQTQKIGWVIYLFSIFTMGYSIYLNDQSFNDTKTEYTRELKGLESSLKIENEILLASTDSLKLTNVDKKIFQKYDKISDGIKKTQEAKSNILEQINASKKEIARLNTRIQGLKNQNESQSNFSIERMKKIKLGTAGLLFYMALIQFLSGFYITKICQSFREKLTKGKKEKGISKEKILN